MNEDKEIRIITTKDDLTEVEALGAVKILEEIVAEVGDNSDLEAICLAFSERISVLMDSDFEIKGIRKFIISFSS